MPYPVVLVFRSTLHDFRLSKLSNVGLFWMPPAAVGTALAATAVDSAAAVVVSVVEAAGDDGKKGTGPKRAAAAAADDCLGMR